MQPISSMARNLSNTYLTGNFMLSTPNAIWVILAGGRATRMGGQDKGLVTLNQKPLIEYVYECLDQQGAKIAINANRNLTIYNQYGEVFKDDISDFPGPLGGMQAALTHLEQDWIGFVPCDCPNLPKNLLQKMYKAIDKETEILVAHDGANMQPVVTMLHKKVLARLNDFLKNGDRKIVLLYQICNTKMVDFTQEKDCFINLNTPDELKKYGEIA
jgi:molybdopterin-guanine dinucleotide biosynthesis protein A